MFSLSHNKPIIKKSHSAQQYVFWPREGESNPHSVSAGRISSALDYHYPISRSESISQGSELHDYQLDVLTAKHNDESDEYLEESKGFEPLERSARSPVFKTGAFNRSANSPLVLPAGFEPASLAARAPKTRVYASSTTGASHVPCSFVFSFMAGALGFEPRLTVPKTVVLPLHHAPIQDK